MIYDIVFLFDVDNTLLDNDRVGADLDVHIRLEHGATAGNRYWEIFEALRSELGYADYLGALERYRREEMHDPRILRFERLDLRKLAAVGLDETAAKRGHTYVTVFIDLDRSEKPVVFVTPGHGKETVVKFREQPNMVARPTVSPRWSAT